MKNHSGEKFAEIRTYAGCFSGLYLYNGIALCNISIVRVHITVAALLWIQLHYFHTCSPQIVEMQPGFWSPFSFPASATCLAMLHPLQPQTRVPLSWIQCHGTLCVRALCKYMRAQHGDLQLAYRRRRKIQCICAKVHPIRMKSYELVMHEWVGDQQIFWLWHSPPKPWQ